MCVCAGNFLGLFYSVMPPSLWGWMYEAEKQALVQIVEIYLQLLGF